MKKRLFDNRYDQEVNLLSLGWGLCPSFSALGRCVFSRSKTVPPCRLVPLPGPNCGRVVLAPLVAFARPRSLLFKPTFVAGYPQVLAPEWPGPTEWVPFFTGATRSRCSFVCIALVPSPFEVFFWSSSYRHRHMGDQEENFVQDAGRIP